ncbi:MAG: YiiX/YebB-like N1pC/P60 family cysteine hydrolase [Isosphaeraceae bacterium]|nr:YiiX/YebB-like N1pC/P60 family cysteine hydrolase [Isosphaeraceae bacterium]
MWTVLGFFLLLKSGHDNLEPTDRLIPVGYVGNPWGPTANEDRQRGVLPPLPLTPAMKGWDDWGKKTLQDGDLLFRRGDARIFFGTFPVSRFIANFTSSRYSHTGTVLIEDGEPYVYDMTKAGPRRQPFRVWILDNVHGLGVRRLRPECRGAIPKIREYLLSVYRSQIPFDYDLELDDSSLYCVEMAEKAFRAGGIVLSEPVRLGDLERACDFPICVFVFSNTTSLNLEKCVYLPGNERNGQWSSPLMTTVYPLEETPRTAESHRAPKPDAEMLTRD